MTHLRDLHDENFVHVLTYLRATDLASAREVDKTIFSGPRISSAIGLLLKDVYTFPVSSPVKKISSEHLSGLRRPDQLYVKEISSISFALSSHQPLPPQGTKQLMIARNDISCNVCFYKKCVQVTG